MANIVDLFSDVQMQCIIFLGVISNNKQHKNRGILNYLEEWLLLQDTNDFAEKIPLVWSAVILLPHVR